MSLADSTFANDMAAAAADLATWVSLGVTDATAATAVQAAWAAYASSDQDDIAVATFYDAVADALQLQLGASNPLVLPYRSTASQITAMRNYANRLIDATLPPGDTRTPFAFDFGTATPASGYLAEPAGTTGTNSTNTNAGIPEAHRTLKVTPHIAFTTLTPGDWRFRWSTNEDAFNLTGQRIFDITVTTPEQGTHTIDAGVDLVARAGPIDTAALRNYIHEFVYILHVGPSGDIAFDTTDVVDHGTITTLVVEPVVSVPLTPFVDPTIPPATGPGIGIIGGGSGYSGRISSTLATVSTVHSDRLPSFCGAGGHLHYDGSSDAAHLSWMPKFLEMGMRVYRDGWVVEPIGRGTEMWGKVQTLFATYGGRIIYLADPRRFDGGDNSYAALVARFKLQMDKIVELVHAGTLDKNAILAIEWPNEWDNFLLAQLGQFIDDTIAYAKAAMASIGRSDMIYMSPAMADNLSTAKTDQIGNKTGKITLNTTHDYNGGVQTVKARLDAVYAAASRVVPGAQVGSTETDFSNGITALPYAQGGNAGHAARTEADCAWLTPCNYLMRFADGRWAFCCKYEITNLWHDDPADWESAFGLLHHDFTLKPAGQAMKNLLNRCADKAHIGFQPVGPKCQATGMTGNTQTQMMFNAALNRYQLLIWEATESKTNIPVTITLDTAKTATFQQWRFTSSNVMDAAVTGQHSIVVQSRCEPLLVEFTVPA